MAYVKFKISNADGFCSWLCIILQKFLATALMVTGIW